MSDAPGLRKRKKTETRVAIQQAVLFLALGRGLDVVTADEIAAAANVSVRTFHNYFGSKEEALTAAWVSEFEVHVDALRDRPADEPILDALEHVFGEIASRIGERPGAAESHADLLWTSVAMTRYRSILLDAAVRMVTDVVAARTGTDAAADIYPHLVTAAAIAAMVTAYQFTPASGAAGDHARLLGQAFALLRSGLERVQTPPT
jgi:AcrR family transcriptional regulator